MSNRIITPIREDHLFAKDVVHATAAAGTFTTVNEAQTYDTYDFDQTSSELITFQLIMPFGASRYGGTVYWTAASGTGGVFWQMQSAYIRKGLTLDAADVFSLTNSGTLSGALLLQHTELPIGAIGTSERGAMLNLDLYRIPTETADTLNADARFLALVVRFYA